jgi:hypothetical protein
MNITEVKKKLSVIKDWRELHDYEIGDMLECAMEHIKTLESRVEGLEELLNRVYNDKSY